MAQSAQTSNKSTYTPNPQNAAYKNDTMMLNELKEKNSIFFARAEKDGNVHIIVPRYTDAASNKTISMAQGVYIAQSFKTQGVKTHRAITYNGAKSLGTTIRTGEPHVEITSSIKLDDKDKALIAEQNEKLIAENKPKNKSKIEANKQALETGYKNVAYMYYPAWAVENTKALKNAFKIPNTAYINEKAFEAFKKELKAEKEGKKPDLPKIDGNNAKDWKEHVKNCMTGNEVVLSKEKASELATAMINDLENAREAGNPFLFQQTAKEANFENLKEAKERIAHTQEQLLGIDTKTHEIPEVAQHHGVTEEEEISR